MQQLSATSVVHLEHTGGKLTEGVEALPAIVPELYAYIPYFSSLHRIVCATVTKRVLGLETLDCVMKYILYILAITAHDSGLNTSPVPIHWS